MASAPEGLSVVCDVLLVLMFVVATVSNSLVLVVFYRRPGLRSLSNRFVINLLTTNLLSCWLLLAVVVADSTLSSLSHVLCAVSQGVVKGLCAASVFSVLLIGVDQYLAVLDPLHYHSHIDNARCALMITCSWCVSVLCAVVGGILHTGCGDDSSHNLVPDPYISVFFITYSLLTFCLPFSVICWMYLSIYFAAHQNSQRARRNGSSAGYYTTNTVGSQPRLDYAEPTPSDTPTHSVKSAGSGDPVVFTRPGRPKSPTRSSIRRTSTFIINTLRSRISNASLFKYREETRAARISALVIVMGLVCWCPYSLVVLLSSPVFGIQVPYQIVKMSVTLLVLVTVVSPLLFAHRNRRVQRDIRKLFGLSNKRSPSVYPGAPQRPRSHASAETQRPPNRLLPPNYSHTALELLGSLAEGTDELKEPSRAVEKRTSFLSRVWWKDGVQITTSLDKSSGNTLICVPEVALDVDNSRCSFSSGGSSSTQRSTSAASFSSYTQDDDY